MVGALTEVEQGEEGIPDESDDDDCVSVNDYYDDNESINDQLNEEDDFHIDCIRQYIPPPPHHLMELQRLILREDHQQTSEMQRVFDGQRWETYGLQKTYLREV